LNAYPNMLDSELPLQEKEKKELALSIEKRYGKRKNFKIINTRANRKIYREDILQPHQREFRDVYKKTMEDRELIYDAVEREQIRKEKELDTKYIESNRNVVSLAQLTLRDLHRDHPRMVSEEDIITWK